MTLAFVTTGSGDAVMAYLLVGAAIFGVTLGALVYRRLGQLADEQMTPVERRREAFKDLVPAYRVTQKGKPHKQHREVLRWRRQA